MEGFKINDLTPVGYQQKEGIKCTRHSGWRGRGLTPCSEYSETPFYKYSKLDLFLDFANDKRDVPIGVEFDYEAFNTAVGESLVALKLNNEGRRKLIAEFPKASDELKNIDFEYPKVIDKSGWLNASQLKTLESKINSRLSNHALANYRTFAVGSFSNVFDALNDGKIKERASAIERVKERYCSDLKSVESTHGSTYDFAPYKVVFNCPDKVTDNTNPFEGWKVTVREKQLRLNVPLPKSISFGNKDISIEKKGNSVTISNNSEKFISIQQIALYYNKEVPYQYNMGHGSDMPPMTEKDIGYIFTKLSGMIKEDRIFSLSQKEAANRKFNIAVAVRYLSDGDQRSLFDKRRWTLLELM